MCLKIHDQSDSGLQGVHDVGSSHHIINTHTCTHTHTDAHMHTPSHSDLHSWHGFLTLAALAHCMTSCRLGQESFHSFIHSATRIHAHSLINSLYVLPCLSESRFAIAVCVHLSFSVVLNIGVSVFCVSLCVCVSLCRVDLSLETPVRLPLETADVSVIVSHW